MDHVKFFVFFSDKTGLLMNPDVIFKLKLISAQSIARFSYFFLLFLELQWHSG